MVVRDRPDPFQALQHAAETPELPAAVCPPRPHVRSPLSPSRPALLDSTALYWNRRMFREAGLDPDRPPRTRAELIAAARRLTRRDSAGRLARLGLEPPEPWPILFAAGAPLVAPAPGYPAGRA